MWLLALAGCGLKVVTLIVDDHQDTVLEGIDMEIPEDLAETLGDDLKAQPLDLSWELALGDLVAEQDISEGDLSSVVLRQLEISVVKPAEQDLGFLEDLVLMIDGTGLDVETVASLGFGDTAGAHDITLDASQIELVDYLLSPGLLVVTEASGEPPPEDLVLRLSYVIEVGVTLRGVVSQL